MAKTMIPIATAEIYSNGSVVERIGPIFVCPTKVSIQAHQEMFFKVRGKVQQLMCKEKSFDDFSFQFRICYFEENGDFISEHLARSYPNWKREGCEIHRIADTGYYSDEAHAFGVKKNLFKKMKVAA